MISFPDDLAMRTYISYFQQKAAEEPEDEAPISAEVADSDEPVSAAPEDDAAAEDEAPISAEVADSDEPVSAAPEDDAAPEDKVGSKLGKLDFCLGFDNVYSNL